MEDYTLLVKELIKQPVESGWVEFKRNYKSPDQIGEYISALGNSAAYYGKDYAYMLWGIDDATHEIIGTDFNYKTEKIGNEELENWLMHLLSSNAQFSFHDIYIDNKKVVLLIVTKAINQTIKFKKTEYIRVGSYKKLLNDCPSIEVQLWNKLTCSKYEELLAVHDLRIEEVLRLLDYPAYFDMLQIPLPASAQKILHYLIEDKIIQRQDNGLFSITNMGAIMFAKKISDFPNLSRKSIRVIQYKNNNKISVIRQDTGTKGYASGFDGLIKYIDGLLPKNEVVKVALRKEVAMYPLIAVRELVANALVHQDFAVSGTGPIIEIFSDRLEITNPGTSLVDINRIIDNPPKSRNEILASLMRRIGVCEELGSGWDKVALSCEEFQLPAPKIEVYEENTKVTLFGHIPFGKMTHEDKLRACYLHACIKQVSNEQMNNSSLRERFGLPVSGMSSISRLIKDAIDRDMIKPVEPNTAPRHMKYVPFWA